MISEGEGLVHKENKVIKENIIWNSIGSISYLFFQWIITVLTARILGYKEAGVLALAMSITNIFSCIAQFGVRNFQVSDIEAKYSDLTYIKNRILTCVTSMGLCIIYISFQKYPDYQKLCILIYMVFRIGESFVDVFHGIDQKNWRMDIVGKSFLLRGLFMFITTVLVMYYTNNLFVSIIGMTIATILIIVLYDKKETSLLIQPTSKNVKTEMKDLTIECLPLATYLLMSTAMGSIPRIFLETISGSEKLGIYSSIASPTLIVQALALYIFTPLIGLFAEYIKKNDKRNFFRLFQKVIVLILLIGVITIIGALVLGTWAMKLLFGSSIIDHIYLLIPIIICTILTAFSWFLCMIITVQRNMKGLIISNIIGVLINIVSSFYFIKQFDMSGANYSLICSFTVQIVLLIYYMIKSFDKKMSN